MRRSLATAAVVAAMVVTGGTAVAQQAGASTRRSADLDTAFDRGGNAAGTVCREVVFANRGLHECVLRGLPGVSRVDGDGNQVGSAARRVGERGPPLTLPHGTAVRSDVGFAQVDNFDPDVCRKTPVWGIRVFPPDETVPLYLPMTDQHGCAGHAGPFGDQLTAASVRS